MLSAAKAGLPIDPLVRLLWNLRSNCLHLMQNKMLYSVTQTNKLVSPILESSSHLSPSLRYSYTKKQILSSLNNKLTSCYAEKIHPLLVQCSFLIIFLLETLILIVFLWFVLSLGGYACRSPLFYRLSSFSGCLSTYAKKYLLPSLS